MRLTRWMQGLMLVSAAACSSSVTAPPSGLPTSLTPVFDDGNLPPSSVSGAGDSVTAVAIRAPQMCPPRVSADAGIRGSTLVITLIDVESNPSCEAIVAASAYSITVKDVPSGTRLVQVVRRDLTGGLASDQVVLSTSLTLP